MPNVMIDTRRVRPVALDGDERKPLSLDQFARNALTHTIELRRAMRCLTEENDAGVADTAQQRLEVGRSDRVKPFTGSGNGLGQHCVQRSDGGPIGRRDGSSLLRRPAFLAHQRDEANIRYILGPVFVLGNPGHAQ